jgi:VanZ family protein
MQSGILVKALPVVFWLALVFTMAMALLPQPPVVLEVNDKLQHMAAFAALTLLAAVSFPKPRYRRIFVAMAALGAAIEVLQMIPSLRRDAQVSDWLADCAAIIAVLLFCAAMRWLLRKTVR